MVRSPATNRRVDLIANHRSGYSIVELLIVVLILGIISVNVAPQFVSAVGQQSVKTAARRIKIDIEQQRLRARTNCTTQSVIFAPELNAYFLPGVIPVDPQQSIYRVDLNPAGSSAAEIVSAQFPNANDAELQFNRFGVPDSAGFVVLQASNYQQTVNVSDSGLVELGPTVWVP